MLRAHVTAVNARTEVLLLRLRAEGRHFCSGFDLNHALTDSAQRISEFAEMVDAFEDARPVTLAFLEGGAYGGGADLALACDFRIGTTQAELMVPAAQLGLHLYQRGLQRFVSRLGINHAKRLLLAAELLRAQEMADCGFLTHFVRTGEPEEVLEKLTSSITHMAPLAVLGMKKHLNGISSGKAAAVELEKDFVRAANSWDLYEGVSAWFEKRAPQFGGN